MSLGAPRRPWRAAGLLALAAALAACAGEPKGAAESPDPFASIEARAGRAPVQREAAPRWEEVKVLNGSGPLVESFAVVEGAIQWKAEWSCDSGRILLTVDPPPRKKTPLADAACPGKGEGFSIQTGTLRLKVEAEGPWRVAVRQQVTTPLDEPPLPEMLAPGARTLKRGTFYDIEKSGSGTALVYALPGRGLAVRLEQFETSENTDLFVWASEAARPATSKEAFSTPHVVLADLKSTLGNQNYPVPAELPADRIRSIVVWCQPIQIAYVAASLD